MRKPRKNTEVGKAVAKQFLNPVKPIRFSLGAPLRGLNTKPW